MGKVVISVVIGAAVCAAAAAAVRHRVMRSRKWERVRGIVEDFDEKCGTHVGRLRLVADAMAVEMHGGLVSEGGSLLQMLITFVDNLPTGFVDLCSLL